MISRGGHSKGWGPILSNLQKGGLVHRFYHLLEARRLLSDSALRFDGVNDFVDMGNPADDHLDLTVNATIEMKVNFKALPAFGSKATFISKGTASASWFFGYSRESVNGIDFSGLDLEIVTPEGVTSGGGGWIPQLNRWYHLALVKTDHTYVPYIDGIAHGTDFSSLSPPHSEAPLQVGRAQGQRPFNGMIDEVRLWSDERTASEINANRNKTLTGNEANLVGYWDFNDAPGSQVALDRSPFKSNGRLGSSTAVDVSDPAHVMLSASGASIAGTLFNDLDGDGIKDAGEGALAGWSVFVDSDKDGIKDASEKSATTDASGNYRFSGLATGSYRVRQLLKSTWRRTTPTSGYHDITLASGGAITGKNFGNTQKILISGSVFNDLDGDKIKDSIEKGLSSWRVFIDKDNDGRLDAGEVSVLTDSSGNYSFKSLAAGTYKVRIVQQTGWTRTTPTSGYHAVTLSAGGTAIGKLFGEKKS